MKNPLFSAAFAVLTFWWVVLTLLFGEWDDFEFTQITDSVVFMGFGTLLGAVMVIAFGYINRVALEARLTGQNVRGLSVTMGMVPTLKYAPRRASTLPDLKSLRLPGVTNLDFLDEWRERWQGTHPAHVALLDAVLKTFHQQAAAPATHIKDGHGGHTLLEHSILTSFVMSTQVAPVWEWRGNCSKDRKRHVLIKPRNPAYKFNPDDPLILITGLAHDLGKLECYLYDKQGGITGGKREHDIVSSQMLGRMEETWALPDADRDVLLLSIGHYHHVPDMPMEAKDKPLDDRLMAFTELLIHSDRLASNLEQGKSLAESEQEAEDVGPSEAKQDTLLTAFMDIVSETERINGDDRRYRIGQKFTLGGKKYIYFRERSLVQEIGERSGLDASAEIGSGEFQLTRELLTTLDEQGVLYRKHEGKQYDAVNALWRVEFRKKNGDYLAEWPATIIIELTESFLPSLLALDDADVIPLIKGPLHAEQRGKKGNTGVDLGALSEMDAEALLAAATLQPGTLKPGKKAAKRSPAPVAATPVVAPVPEWAEDSDPDEDTPVPAAPTAEPPDWTDEDNEAGAAAEPAADREPDSDTEEDSDSAPSPASVSEPVGGAAALADNVAAEALEVCEQIASGKLPKAVAHPEQAGVFVVRSTHLTPISSGFSWLDSVPAIEDERIPGVRCQFEGKGATEVLFLLFNVKTVLSRQGGVAFDRTEDAPIHDKADPW